jgi:glycosyltransferase involved in cell wall biosynthesis
MRDGAGLVLQLCGDPVGGVRRHVHSILLGATSAAPRYAYVFSSIESDQQFNSELDALSRGTEFMLSLKICKKPVLGDVLNIYKLMKLVKTRNVLVVHGHGAKAGVYARLLKIFCKVAVIYTPHGGVLHDFLPWYERLLFIMVERILKHLTDFVVVESEYSRSMFLEKIGKPSCPLVVNYNGVGHGPDGMVESMVVPFNRGGEGDVHLGIFARFHPMKGQEMAVRACAKLACELKAGSVNRRYHFHFFGGGKGGAAIKELTDQLGCAERVHFHGDVNQPEMLMQYFDAILIPSQFESFSYVAAEALMMRVPVVATQVGGLSEVLADSCGLLVAEYTPSAFAMAIQRLSDEPDLAACMVERGYERYRRLFTDVRMVNFLEKLYWALLKSSK